MRAIAMALAQAPALHLSLQVWMEGSQLLHSFVGSLVRLFDR